MEEIVATLSDLHLGEGTTFPDGAPNPREDFLRDKEFSHFTAYLLLEHSHAEKIRLQLLGDVFDPLVVPYAGKFDALPYETTCVAQMQRIIEGHPLFFDALKEFLSDSRAEIFFYIGNHDFFMEWNAVQELLVKRIGQTDSTRIHFTYAELHRGTYYTHGNIEPHNAIDSSNRYLLPARHANIKEPLLNYPYGSYFGASMVSQLRLEYPYIGRLRYHGYWFKEAATRNWQFGVRVLWVGLRNFIEDRFFSFWDVRRKANFRTTVKMLWWLLFGTKQETFSARLIKKNSALHAVVMGHDHHARHAVMKEGLFFNTGTWALTYDIIWHNKPNPPFGFTVFQKLFEYAATFWHKPEFVRVDELPVVFVLYKEHGGQDQSSEVPTLMHWDDAKGCLVLWEKRAT